MFWPDVIEIKSFYASRLGRLALRSVLAQIEKLWPEVRNETILGIGFTPPYLRSFTKENVFTAAVMPATQGVIHWPATPPNRTLIAEEYELPFPDHSMDRIILAHVLEHTNATTALMEEIRRVLVPGGQILAIVPNRRGIWARMENTPFGSGRPYSRPQLERLMNEHGLTPARCRTVLFTPPVRSKLLLRSWRMFEEIGRRFFTPFGGVLMLEAEKLLYAARPKGAQIKHSVLRIPATQQPALGLTQPRQAPPPSRG